MKREVDETQGYGQARRRGLSKQKLCIAAGIDARKEPVAVACGHGRPSAARIRVALGGRVAKGATLVHDRERAQYAQASADAGDGAAIGERTVRGIMRDEGLVACAARKRRRCSSYEGEISEAPTNLLRDGRGKHHFRANKPNKLWITDVTEFRIPAGKAYLPPIAGCSGGMPLGWPASTSPDAGMASPPLPGACRRPSEGDHPRIRPDRGCHCRWPGWIRICDENGLARSMPGKGCSPGSARCEGFFGRLKTEFFHGCGWAGAALEKFMGILDAYLRWYRDVRIKGDLDCRSPMQYRRDLGLLAA